MEMLTLSSNTFGGMLRKSYIASRKRLDFTPSIVISSQNILLCDKQPLCSLSFSDIQDGNHALTMLVLELFQRKAKPQKIVHCYYWSYTFQIQNNNTKAKKICLKDLAGDWKDMEDEVQCSGLS